ncbi:MAG: M15 family metallopeptidase [Candidatus Pacebacteria bacterium]|nr:M15 family metallopeptidase [Candidatus Paceibacterota bacterium]
MKAANLKAAIAALVVVIVALALGFLWYYKDSKTSLDALVADYEARLATVSADLARAEAQNTELGGNLEAERERNNAFEDQIKDISGTVGDLDKLAKTDPELLQKYSKIYFLNENYSPTGAVSIKKKYVYGESESVHEKVWPFLEDLLEDAEDDDIDLKVISGYRSFGTQAALKSGYKVTYGSGANAFSADQGYSEHQLGTTVDFTTDAIGSSFAGFDQSEAFTWLTKNAYRYGFVLSYPKGNTYYQYEPWHWRFVGTDLARDLHKDGKNFYDLDQREIDTYLITLFD